MYRAKFMPRNGTGAVVIAPTRELAMQIYGVTRDVMKHHSQTHGALQTRENLRWCRGIHVGFCSKQCLPLV